MRTWWIILVFSFVLFSLTSTLYELQKKETLNASRSFELVHNYYTDYNFYLSRIRQGYDGKWLVHETYTNEPHQGTIIHEFYLLLGQAARFIPDVSLAVPASYHVVRGILGIALLGAIAWITTLLFPSFFWQVIAFLIVVTGAGWPLITQVGTTWRFNNYMPWWTVLEPLQRITFIPHIMASQVGLLFLTMTTPTRKNWIVLAFFAMGVGIVMPQALMMVFAIYIILSFFEYFFEKRTDRILPRFYVAVCSVWTILYFVPFLTMYPWKRLIDFEVLHPTKFSYFEYLKTFGISLPLGVLGAFMVLRSKDTKWFPIVAWGIGVPFVVFLLCIKPIQHPLRFTEMAAYIPLGLLAAYVIHTWINTTLQNRSSFKPYSIMVLYALSFLFILYGLATMYHQWFWQKDFIDMKISAGYPAIPMNNYIVYPAKSFTDAIRFINEKTESESVILSDMTAGNYIPAYTGRRVYLGHENTSYKEEKMTIVKQFFSGKMDPKNAYAWMRKEGITYVFFGIEERTPTQIDLAATYPFLRQVYTNTDVTIYALPESF